MPVDLSAEIAQALSSTVVSKALVELLADRVADAVVDRMKKRDADSLQPLATILGISPRAALGRLQRDGELKQLGHQLGRRLVFRREEVLGLLAARHRENGHGAELRVVGSGVCR